MVGIEHSFTVTAVRALPRPPGHHVSRRAWAAAPCGRGTVTLGTVTLGTATSPVTPAMPRERMNEWPGNHGHRGPGNADPTKTDRTQRPNKAYIFCI